MRFPKHSLGFPFQAKHDPASLVGTRRLQILLKLKIALRRPFGGVVPGLAAFLRRRKFPRARILGEMTWKAATGKSERAFCGSVRAAVPGQTSGDGICLLGGCNYGATQLSVGGVRDTNQSQVIK